MHEPLLDKTELTTNGFLIDWTLKSEASRVFDHHLLHDRLDDRLTNQTACAACADGMTSTALAGHFSSAASNSLRPGAPMRPELLTSDGRRCHR